jgi:diguanylate cyclase (GGDEF)-like protein
MSWLKKFANRADRRFVLLFIACLIVPMMLVAVLATRELENRTLVAAEEHLRDGAKDYALSVLRRLEYAQSELRLSHLEDPTGADLRFVRNVRLVDDDSVERAGITKLDRGFEIRFPYAGEVLRGEISDQVLFAELGHAPSGVSRCIYIDGEMRVCDRGLGLVGASRVVAEYQLPVATVFDADFAISVRVAEPRSMALKSMELIAEVLLGGLLVVGLLAGGLVLVQIRRRVAPVALLREGLRSIGGGDYRQQLEISTGDEFEDLSGAFNKMSRDLEMSFNAMQELSELDRLILSGAEPEEIARQALVLAERTTGVICCVCLRDEVPGHGMLLEVAGGELVQKDLRVPDELTSEQMLVEYLEPHIEGPLCAQFSVMHEGSLSGVLLGKGSSSLDGPQARMLSELADRLSVAATSWNRARTLYRQANFDTLTGLLNRQAFSDRLSQCIDGTRRRATQGALLFMDLDKFKRVNDTEGHAAGDQILNDIATRLSNHLRSTDIVARLGGDEFAIIVPEYDVETELDALCKKIIEDVRLPILINRADYALDVSIGVSLFPRDGTDVSALLMKADVAMYKAKEQAGSSFAFFDEQLNLAAAQRVVIESELRRALGNQALGVHFQPKVQLKDLEVVGLEALIRWPESGFGNFTPDEFVPVAEETGLIHDFSEVVIGESIRCLQKCRRRGFQIDRAAVNISDKQFAKPGFADRFLEIVSRNQGRPGDFEIEVTESLFLRETSSVVTELRSLRSAGVTIALDDFGEGYSSLNVLRSFPLDVVKMDRSFVAPLSDTPAARNIARRVIEIAQALYLEVVAEGVESPEELRILQSMGCELAQGFVIGRPLAIADLLEFLAQRSSHHNDQRFDKGSGGGVAL